MLIQKLAALKRSPDFLVVCTLIAALLAISLLPLLFSAVASDPNGDVSFWKTLSFLCIQSRTLLFFLLGVLFFAIYMFSFNRIPLKSQPKHILALIALVIPNAMLVWAAYWHTIYPHGVRAWQEHVLMVFAVAYCVISLSVIAQCKGERAFFLFLFLCWGAYCFSAFFVATMAISNLWL